MMKGFKGKGKYFGLMLAAFALVFAGCAGGPSEDDSASPSAQNVTSVPITVDPGNASMIIGDGVQSADTVYFINGHSVTIMNGATHGIGGNCDATADGADCWVRLVNRDSDEYMANVYIDLSACEGCLGANLTNADIPLSGGTDCPTLYGEAGSIGDPGAPYGAIDGGAFCFVEDGEYYTVGKPYNENCCKTHRLTTATGNGINKPVQVIHPECGAVGVEWIFGNQTEPYKFLAGLNAQYYPWDPSSDGRYDWTDRNTFYVMVTQLDDNFAGLGYSPQKQNWYRIGSYQRSTVVAGYGAGTSGTSVAPGQYFGVNVAVEYANRIEARNIAEPSTFTNYEYIYGYNYIMKFDPFTVNYNTTANKQLPGGTFIQPPGKTCGPLGCGRGVEGWNGGLNEIATQNNSQGWVALTMVATLSSTFTFFNAFSSYKNLTGTAFIGAGNYGNVCAYCAHLGMVKMKTGFLYTGTQYFIQDGADPDPDFPMYLYYFYALPGSSGRGSEFWIDTVSGYTNFKYAYTAGDLAGGYTQDWTDTCWPMDPANMNSTDKGCPDTDSESQIVWKSLGERSNYAISHSGPEVPGILVAGDYKRGAYQQWPAHVCVQ